MNNSDKKKSGNNAQAQKLKAMKTKNLYSHILRKLRDWNPNTIKNSCI